MTTNSPSPEQIKEYKDRFIPGTKIRLIRNCDNEPALPANIEGTVKYVDDIGSVHCKWDNGSSLAFLPYVDEYEILS